MKSIKTAYFVFLSILLINNSKAALPGGKTIEECIEIGLKNSRGLHYSLMKAKSANAKASEANVLRLPSLSLNASYTRMSDVPPFEIESPFPPPAPASFTISPTIVNNYGLRITLQQPFFTGFRLHSNYKNASNNALASEEEYKKDRADLIYNIRYFYWSLFKAIEIRKVVDENVELVKTHLNDVRNFLDQGLVTKNEVLKVRVQLSNARLLQVETGHNVRLARIALNSLIGLPLNEEYDPESVIGGYSEETGNLEMMVRKAIENRAEIRAMEYRVEAVRAGVTAAKSGWFPQIYLVGNYYYSRPNPRILPSEDRFEDTWDAGIVATFDIWNWGKTVHRVRQANANLSQVHDVLAQLIDAVALDVTHNYFDVSRAEQQLEIAESGVRLAEENYRITNEKFKGGMALNSDLLDSEVALLEAKTNLTNALVDYKLAIARLNRSVGE